MPTARRMLQLAALVVLAGGAVAGGHAGGVERQPVSSGATSARVARARPAVEATDTVPTETSCAEKSLLPAYFYPGPTWEATLEDMTPGADLIVNPSSGPGTQIDPNYSRVVSAARARGGMLWGYIDTAYTHVALSSLVAQIGEYRSWYGITNIFFDDVSSDANSLGYYRAASAAVRRSDPRASVILNPGDYPASSYAALGDVIVVFEGDESSFLATRPPAWVGAYPASMFADLVSAVPAAAMPSVVTLARRRHSGYVYVTDHVDVSTLYEQLPTYWRAELAETAATCVTTTPTGSPPPAPSRPRATGGYWLATAKGGVYAFDAGSLGSAVHAHLATPIVAISATPDGHGYWLATRNGQVLAFGNAHLAGSLIHHHLASPVVGMATDRATGGYWLATAKGGVYAFDAGSLGSAVHAHLATPIVAISATPDGHGYWLATRNGQVLAFGNAHLAGSLIHHHLASPVVGIGGSA